MADRRTVRLEVHTREALDGLVDAALPLHLQDEARDLDVFRDVYFDTPARDLAPKGAIVRIRHRRDGTQSLLIDLREPRAGGPMIRHHAEAAVTERDPAAVFQGDSEPARMLRAVIEPARLEAVFEVETQRRLRTGRLPGGAELRIAYDTLTVRRGSLAGTLREVVLTADTGVDLDPVIRAMENAEGVRMTLSEPIRRARDLLHEAEISALEREVRRAREVAMVAHAGGRVALRRIEEGLRIPCGEGSGEAAARRLVRRTLADAAVRVRLLDTSPGGPGRPALEVWTTEEVPVEATGPDVVWLPLADVLQMVGSTALREPRTLAALEAAARSDLSGVADPEDEDQTHGDRNALKLALPRPTWLDEPSRDLPTENLLNAELSRIAFDERILVFAESDETPLLERVRFLSMFGSRQDDFFMSRVAGFKEELMVGARRLTLDGLSAREQLDLIAIRTRQVSARANQFLRRRLLPGLEDRGLRLLRMAELTDEEREYLRNAYATDAEAVLTPMVADSSHPFPHIRNLRPAIAAVVRLPDADRSHFMALELPGELPRFLPLPGGGRFVTLEDFIIDQLPTLSAGLRVESAHVFRVTRSAKTQLEDTLVGDVLQAVEEDVAGRPFRAPVRLEVDAAMPAALRNLILRELRYEAAAEPATLGPQDVYTVDGLIDLAALKELADVELPEVEGPPAAEKAGPPVTFEPLERRDALDPDRSIFELLRERDRLVYFPFDKFETSAERFILEAAEDPDVVSLKVTLYRTDASSAIVRALARARELGKDAVALIEIKASFDEQQNIAWAKSLAAAGIHVVFSPLKYKVHAKAGLVVRQEENRLVRYCYIGTGNLNSATAKSYTDVALLTANPELGEELQAVFNILTGYSAPGRFRHLLVSPFNMRHRFLSLIEREIRHAREGRPARLRGQLNGLADRRLIAKLYEASQAGVQVELAVREICALRPGVPGISENIRVVSVLGRLLQHARIFEFGNGGDTELFIGSADWRPRNLSRRVEVAAPVWDPPLKEKLSGILDRLLSSESAWELRPDGSHVRDGEVVGGQAALDQAGLAIAHAVEQDATSEA